MSDGKGDNYMTESAMESDGADPVRDEEYFEHGHSSPHNPPSAIPDNADFEPQVIEPAFTPAEIDEILGNDPDSADEPCPHCERVDDPEPKEFISIDPNSKWVLVLPDDTDYEMANRVAERIQNWWDGVEGYDWPILVIGGSPGLHLVRVDEDEVGPELVDCGQANCPGHLVGGGEKCLTSDDLYQAE